MNIGKAWVTAKISGASFQPKTTIYQIAECGISVFKRLRLFPCFLQEIPPPGMIIRPLVLSLGVCVSTRLDVILHGSGCLLEIPAVDPLQQDESVTGPALITDVGSASVLVIEAKAVLPATGRASRVLAGEMTGRDTAGNENAPPLTKRLNCYVEPT
jgi:hypothetical protein